MSFYTEINKPYVEPVVLFEVDISQLNSFWNSYTAYTYYVQLDANYNLADDTGENFNNGASTFPNITKIGSVIATDIRLLEVTSPMECHETESSFYWDGSSKTLYVHLPNHSRPELFIMKLGSAFGFRMNGTNSFSYVNNFIYDDRILSISPISKSKDSFFFGKVSFDGGQVVLSNHDGYFDNLINTNRFYGASARFYFGTENLTISEFRKIFSGYIRNIKLNINEVTFDIVDEREKLSKNISENYLSTVSYPDLKDEDIGKLKPVVYGKCKRVPTIIVTEGRSSTKTGNHTGIVCDVTTNDYGIKKVEKIYIGDTKNFSTASTKWSYNSLNGNILLSTSIYKPGEKVLADVHGYTDADGNLIENALDIIKDLLRKIYTVPFTSTFYNTAHWDQSRALNVGYCVTDNTKLIDAIEEIANSTRAVFLIEDDGRYSCRIFYRYGASLQTLTHNYLLEIAEISYNTEQSLTSLTVKYNKNWSENDYLSLLNDFSQQDTIFSNLLIYRHENFETIITDDTDAQELITDLLDLYGTATKVISCKTFINTINREIGDIVTMQFNRPETPIMNDALCEVIGINKDPASGQIGLTLRIFDQLSDYLYHQGIYYGDNASSAITNHSIVFGQNAFNQIGSYSAVFGGTRRVSI
jgi:hypothetical protein